MIRQDPGPPQHRCQYPAVLTPAGVVQQVLMPLRLLCAVLPRRCPQGLYHLTDFWLLCRELRRPSWGCPNAVASLAVETCNRPCNEGAASEHRQGLAGPHSWHRPSLSLCCSGFTRTELRRVSITVQLVCTQLTRGVIGTQPGWKHLAALQHPPWPARCMAWQGVEGIGSKNHDPRQSDDCRKTINATSKHQRKLVSYS